MKPLVIMVTYNRLKETQATLASIKSTTLPNDIEFVIIDNGSTDGTAEMLAKEVGDKGEVYYLDENIGCPRALNLAIEKHRQPGQSVVKIDNDVRQLTARWPVEIAALVKWRQELYQSPALISAYYPGVFSGRTVEAMNLWRDWPLFYMRPIIGHCVWHTGEFMDLVGYFDVLADDHLYGFEDLILSAKAQQMGWETLVWEGWRIENLQRHNSLGDQREPHIAKMRPLYNERAAAISQGGSIKTGPDGIPVTS